MQERTRTELGNELERLPCTEQNIEQIIKGRRTPVVLAGLTEGWPARKTWSMEYLQRELQGQNLDVYLSEDQYFPGEYRSPADGRGKRADGRMTKRMTCDELFARLGSENAPYCYLHAYELPQSLVNDVPLRWLSDFAIGRFLWLSSAGNVTPTHFDGSDNVITQVFGRKRVTLFAPDCFEKLYLHGSDHRYARHSQVFDLSVVDDSLYPLFKSAESFSCVLDPGDSLFIPNLWFHCVETITPSASVNAWWNDMPFPNYVELMEEWTLLRDRLVRALPAEMSARYMSYFLRVLLFSDIN